MEKMVVGIFSLKNRNRLRRGGTIHEEEIQGVKR